MVKSNSMPKIRIPNLGEPCLIGVDLEWRWEEMCEILSKRNGDLGQGCIGAPDPIPVLGIPPQDGSAEDFQPMRGSTN